MKRALSKISQSSSNSNSSHVSSSSKKRRLNVPHRVSKRRCYQSYTRTIPLAEAIRESTITKTGACMEIREKGGLVVDYFPNFYGSEKSIELFEKLEKEIEWNEPKDSSIVIFGKSIPIPRKQTAYGDAGITYHFSGNTVPAREWTDKSNETLIEIKNAQPLSKGRCRVGALVVEMF